MHLSTKKAIYMDGLSLLCSQKLLSSDTDRIVGHTLLCLTDGYIVHYDRIS